MSCGQTVTDHTGTKRSNAMANFDEYLLVHLQVKMYQRRAANCDGQEMETNHIQFD